MAEAGEQKTAQNRLKIALLNGNFVRQRSYFFQIFRRHLRVLWEQG